MKLLVGSEAAKKHFPDFRQGKDIDYWFFDEGLKSGIKDGIKYEYKDVSEHEVLKDQIKLCNLLNESEIPTTNWLYTLKVSHSFWDIHWGKTIKDILFFQKKGCDYLPEAGNLLYKVWEEVHGKKKAYLNKINEDFFKDNVKRIYEHDSIHKAMAYYDEPLYKSCKKDKEKALISKELFENLSFNDKLRLCREETYVTALERFIIPSNFASNPIFAYRSALKKLITSMSKGFFPLFIVLNLDILKDPDKDYVEQFRRNEAKCKILH